jgi:quercetin dioxygenase-like cupin family protein
MRRISLPILLGCVLIALAGRSQDLTAQTSTHTSVAMDVKTHDPGIKWGPAPAVLPAGAQLAVLAGDPSGTGEFTVRLKMPNGYRIPPHTHPTDENVTVIEGTFLVGLGTTFQTAGMLRLPGGGFITAPARHAHYAEARGATIVQVNGMGPFQLTYVNPADAPKGTN